MQFIHELFAAIDTSNVKSHCIFQNPKVGMNSNSCRNARIDIGRVGIVTKTLSVTDILPRQPDTRMKEVLKKWKGVLESRVDADRNSPLIQFIFAKKFVGNTSLPRSTIFFGNRRIETAQNVVHSLL